ncbi:MAG: tetratricopeptide repeat protein [Candidatus Krumholzibacteriota bacterium]|nr:tetratricopeptide repeat protein [Candidatus Krumholzibacteriota bacterium]
MPFRRTDRATGPAGPCRGSAPPRHAAAASRFAAAPGLVLLLFALAVLSVSCGGGPRAGAAGREWDAERAALDRRIEWLVGTAQYGDALALVDGALAAGEADARLHAQRARSLAGLDRPEEAVAAWERAIILDYEACASHLDFAVLLMRMGRTGRAITEFDEALLFCDGVDRATVRRNIAVACMKMERYDRAVDQVRRGLAERPGDPWLLGLEGLLVAETEPVRAESLLAASTAGGAADPEFSYQYALLLLRAGRPREAAAILERVPPGGERERTLRMNLAEAWRRLGSFDDAETVLRGLLGGGDDDAVRLRLGRVLFSAKRFEEALDLFGALPPTAESMDRVAMCHHALGDNEAALAWSLRANEAAPDEPIYLVNLAVIRAARGELAIAGDLLRRALEIDPENATAAYNLEQLERATDEMRRRVKGVVPRRGMR